MQNAAIQPVGFRIESMRLRTNTEYRPSAGVITIPAIRSAIGIEGFSGPTGAEVFRCRLELSTVMENMEKVLPYELELQVLGDFAFLREVELDQPSKRQLVVANGVNLTYGFARDVVFQQTALGIYGSFLLPAVYFSDDAKSLIEGWQEPANYEAQAISNREPMASKTRAKTRRQRGTGKDAASNTSADNKAVKREPKADT